MRVAILILLASFCSIYSQENKSITVEFHPTFDGQGLVLDEYLDYNNNSDSLLIGSLRLYISNIEFYNDDTIYSVPDSYHLVDADDAESLKLVLELQNDFLFDRMSFNIGIDSATNSAGVFGGDLDPTNGMYWTWQSGYISFKLEGVSPLSPARKNKFEYHIGGYSYPNNTLQTVELEVSNKPIIHIEIDVHKLIESIDISTTNKVMSPNSAAVELSKILPSMFSITN